MNVVSLRARSGWFDAFMEPNASDDCCSIEPEDGAGWFMTVRTQVLESLSGFAGEDVNTSTRSNVRGWAPPRFTHDTSSSIYRWI